MRFVIQPCGHICVNEYDKPGFDVYDDCYKCYVCLNDPNETGCESCDDSKIQKVRIKKNRS